MKIARVASAAEALLLAPIAALAVQAPAQAANEATRPDFRLPFPCNTQIELKTYRGHAPDDKKIDMYRYGMREGSPILASAAGYVHENFSPGGLEIRHGNGWFTTYMHMTGVARPGTCDRVYGLSPDKSTVHQWTGSGENWTTVGGPAHSISGR